MLGYLPLPDTYDKTDKLLQRYLDIKSNVENRQGALPAEVWADYYSVVKGMASIFEISRVLNGLPDSEPLIPIILDEGGTSKQHHNRSIREISWLEEHGTCYLASLTRARVFVVMKNIFDGVRIH